MKKNNNKRIRILFKAVGFAAITLLMPILIYLSSKLPTTYKIGIPLITAITYIILTLRIFNLAQIKKPIWIAYSILLIIAIYFLMPNYLHIRFVNTNGQPIDGMVLADDQPYGRIAIIPRGEYTITYTAQYRQKISYKMDSNFYPWIIIKTVMLEPGIYNFEKTTFLEPYKKKELEPSITVKGKDLDGRTTDIKDGRTTSIPYGTYTIRYDTPLFSKEETTEPRIPPEEIILEPNENTVVLNEQEARWIKNYLQEYVELSAQKIIQPGEWPRQMHLYTKNATLSLGDMLFVLCQLSEKEQPVIYAPKEMRYVKQGNEECYSSMINGKVPATVYGIKAEQAAYELLSDTIRTINFDFGELNQKKKAVEWALSFDVEYGRYVPEEGATDKTFSTCDITTGYLTPEQCKDADYAGWVSESSELWWYDEYDYPVSSGMIGWRTILELSEDYGIPTTQYMVTKDIDLFKKKDPALFEESKRLAQEGLIEIGSHTRYHTRLDKVSNEVAKKELMESKKELEQMYGVPVIGFRNPYLALVGGTIEETEKALAETSYSQYSLYGDHRTNTINGKKIEHKPINFFGYIGYAQPGYIDAALELPYVISLDHPWNIQFHEEETKNGIILREEPKQPEQMKALILEAMSKGAWFTTIEKIEIRS